jgi:predicted ATP-dependent endonuclease of OLD family
MNLHEIRIKNFRCYKDEFKIRIGSLTALIAKNDTGKSSILDATNAFFNHDKLEAGDRSVGSPNSSPIEITCVFDEIPDELIIDTDNLISPSTEHLLNSQGTLEVTKVYRGATPKCEEIRLTAMHPTAARFDDLLQLNITELKTRAIQLEIDLEAVNQSIKSAIRHAIWSSIPVEALEKDIVELDITGPIWKQLLNTMPLFQLFKSDRPSSDQDAEAQDPIKFAIKEALSAKTAQLEEIGKHVKEQVEEVTRMTIEKIREMDPDLANQLNPKFSSFNWSKVFSVSLNDQDHIPLNKRGSGVRRLFLINFFRAKAEQLAQGREVKDVIFAIEEPETSQHPNNQLLLLDALRELAEAEKNQVIFTTHNPNLAGRIDPSSIRYIQKGAEGNREIPENNPETLTEVKNSLGIIANHRIKVFVGVEGPNDIQCINRISAILASTDTNIKDLGAAEEDGSLVYIPMGGSTLELWTNRLDGLDVAEVHILDRDNTPPQAAKYQKAADAVNARGDHCTAFITKKREMENYIHYEAINEEFEINLIEQLNDFDDVPKIVAKAVHEASDSPNAWDELTDEKRKKKESSAKKRLNRGAVSKMSATRLEQVDASGHVVEWLTHISNYLN